MLLHFSNPKNPEKSRVARSPLSCKWKQINMITQLLLAISPLLIALIGLGLMVGLISGRKASRWLGGFVLLLVLAPIRNAILGMLPLWLWLPVMAVLAIRGLIIVVTLLFGRGIAEHAVGRLLADTLSGMFRAILWILDFPFRLIARVIRSRA
jgi:hypothetical protein